MPIVTKNCQPLFDAFIAEGLNTQQLLRDAADIVQNDGVKLYNREVEDWAEALTQKLMQHHRKQLLLVSNTLHALKGMNE
jgi:hypothetical protein